jgi:hypothetical protein
MRRSRQTIYLVESVVCPKYLFRAKNDFQICPLIICPPDPLISFLLSLEKLPYRPALFATNQADAA